MANHRHTKAGDRPRAAGSSEATGKVDVPGFLGRWVNTNANTKCIESFSLVERDNAYFARALGKNYHDIGVLPS